ncbi:GNAT family N-acetyltransferase [Radiobacillus kanasensis]
MFKGWLYNKDGNYCRVISLVVSSRARKRGIGKRLLQEAE